MKTSTYRSKAFIYEKTNRMSEKCGQECSDYTMVKAMQKG